MFGIETPKSNQTPPQHTILVWDCHLDLERAQFCHVANHLGYYIAVASVALRSMGVRWVSKYLAYAQNQSLRSCGISDYIYQG